MKVTITPRGFATYGLDEIERMREMGLEVDYNDTGKPYDAFTFLQKARDSDAVIVGVDDMGEEVLSDCPNLKVICKFGVGIDNIAVDWCREHGIFVGRTVGSNSIAVAELVFAHMLADARNLYQSIKEVKSGSWAKHTGNELHDRILGVVGYGAIGRHVARIAHGFGMRVLVYDVCPISPEIVEHDDVTPVTFEEIIERADYLTLHVPLLATTENMISADELARMKPDACLINTARGGVVDEGALSRALVSGQIRSACFDVWSIEPPLPNSPLLGLDNFTLTPHIGSRTSDSERRTCAMSTDIVLEHLGIMDKTGGVRS